MKKKLHFAVIAVDGSITSAVFGPIELVEGCSRLQASLPEVEPVAITAEILSPDGAPFVGSAGYRMPVDGGLKDLTVTWIRGNLHERFTMDELLRQVPTSRRNLTRRFKMETGEPIQTFIQRLRMDRAKLLLETSSLPIEQVVEQVGYRDTSAFARQFKRHTQLTPNSYRQRYRLRPTAT